MPFAIFSGIENNRPPLSNTAQTVFTGQFGLKDWEITSTDVYASFEDLSSMGIWGSTLAKLDLSGQLQWNKFYQGQAEQNSNLQKI